MQRYKVLGDVWVKDDENGDVVPHSEAQAEIDCLQAEVERTNDVLESQAHVIRTLKSQTEDMVTREWAELRFNASWNDAIEAAASLHDKMSDDVVAFRIKHRGACMEYEENNHPRYASDIRALHRPT